MSDTQAIAIFTNAMLGSIIGICIYEFIKGSVVPRTHLIIIASVTLNVIFIIQMVSNAYG